MDAHSSELPDSCWERTLSEPNGRQVNAARKSSHRDAIGIWLHPSPPQPAPRGLEAHTSLCLHKVPSLLVRALTPIISVSNACSHLPAISVQYRKYGSEPMGPLPSDVILLPIDLVTAEMTHVCSGWRRNRDRRHRNSKTTIPMKTHGRFNSGIATRLEVSNEARQLLYVHILVRRSYLQTLLTFHAEVPRTFLLVLPLTLLRRHSSKTQKTLI